MINPDIQDMVEQLIDLLEACSSDEYVKAQANLCKKQYKTFIEHGFTNDEAFKLLVASMGKKHS